jgi:drug/metabolite transporter (DMT)-like permease
MRRSSAVGIVIASSACFATLAVLTRLAYAEGGPPLPLLVWRFGIASVLMAAYLSFTSPRALRHGLRDLPGFAALSLTGYGAASVCFFFALQHAAASVVTVLLYAYPALVAFGDAVARRRRIPAHVLGSIALTFVGCALVAGLFDARVSVRPAGIVLGLGAAVAYALFTLLSERLTHRPRLVLMTYTFGLSCVGIAAVAALTGVSLSPAGWSARLWLILTGIVAFPSVLAVLLFLRGVRELGAPRTALVSTLEPVFTIALAAMLLGERLSLWQSCGAALVIVGIVLAEWAELRR